MSEAAILDYVREKRFGLATVERWLRKPEADREALLALAVRLRLGENQFRDFLDDLEAIASRLQTAPARVLQSEAVAAVLSRGLGRNESIKALKRALRRLRYPRLVQIEERATALAKSLALPSGAKMALPENLEGEFVTVTLRAISANDLRAQARALSALAGRPEMEEIFRLLEGDW